MNRFSPIHIAAATAAGLYLAMGAWAQPSPAAKPGTTASAKHDELAREDAAFLKQAAQNGHAEVESSKLAADKASSAKVKAFAKQMIEDHTKADAELKKLAAAKSVEVPAEPSVAQRAKIDLLSRSSGDAFDRKYADQMGVEAHEDTVKLFRKAAAEAKDADVKAWATKTLPTLEKHLAHAKTLKAEVGEKS